MYILEDVFVSEFFLLPALSVVIFPIPIKHRLARGLQLPAEGGFDKLDCFFLDLPARHRPGLLVTILSEMKNFSYSKL